ncbi:SGNH/GDSL hydrolase family protein [Actinomyces vulturis]|uniref:SGNH/GDSL hydrolase family protein n=1 Tax=Actinomyces vulturis TaxID=1857645 RepID=UPI00082EF335|nr:SGNH/GDSL hydrolase family protein [Actinomyces vulturis]
MSPSFEASLESTIPRSTHFPTAVFFGDSITTGWRAISHPRNRFSSLICEFFGWREVNLALDGLGFFARRGGRLPNGQVAPSCCDTTWLTTAIKVQPDVLTVCLGINDSEFLPSQMDYVRQGIEHDLAFLKQRLPSTPLVIAPYFPDLHVGPRFQVVHRMIHDVATGLGLYSTDAMSHAIDGDNTKLAMDGIHPNDSGHAALARAMINVYQQILPPDVLGPSS